MVANLYGGKPILQNFDRIFEPLALWILPEQMFGILNGI